MSEPGAHATHPAGSAVSEPRRPPDCFGRVLREPTPWSRELELGEGAPMVRRQAQAARPAGRAAAARLR